jgi:hypothetical protein
MRDCAPKTRWPQKGTKAQNVYHAAAQRRKALRSFVATLRRRVSMLSNFAAR